MGIFNKLRQVLDKKLKIKLVILLIMTFIGALIETVALSIISPYISIIMDNSMIESNKYISYFYKLLGFSDTGVFLAALSFLLAGVYIFRGIYLYFVSVIRSQFIGRNRIRLSERLMKKIINFSYIYHSRHNIAEFQSIILKDVEELFNVILFLLLLAMEVMMSVLIIVFLAVVSLPMTLCVAGLAGGCVIVYYKLLRGQMKRTGEQLRDEYVEVSKSVNQAFGGIKEVKIKGCERYFEEQFGLGSHGYVEAHQKFQVLDSLPKLVLETICFGGSFIIIAFLLMQGANVVSMLPQLSVFVLAAFRLLPSISRVANYYNAVIHHAPSLDAIHNSIYEMNDVGGNPGAEPEISFKNNDITVENVSFAYPGSEARVFENVSLVIPENKSVAFVGSSGSGKTTLADIILGIILPNSGTVAYDGKSVHHNFGAWNKNIGYIPQQIYLLDEDIRKNIAFGVPENEISDEKLWSALEQAQLADFVKSLPEGLKTLVGDRGIRLSGGQRQRIGIARAIYDNPPILVLDEATSSLDTETEHAVMEAINGFQGTKTMIIVAHRLSTIENCDIVYRVEGKTVIREK